MSADVSGKPAAVIIKKTTRRHIPGDSNLHKHDREKLKTFLEVSTFNKHQALLIIKVGRLSNAIKVQEEYSAVRGN
jgi:hypothetical protein